MINEEINNKRNAITLVANYNNKTMKEEFFELNNYTFL